MNAPLPIENEMPAILAALDQARAVVLKAPPGAGKTTGVPPHLMKQSWRGDGEVWLIQPRRLATRSSASRLASLMNGTVGGEVGYQVRFDRKITQRTRLVVMTTGILLRRIQADPFLENVSAILLDEFHERSLEMDLSLGMIQRIITAGRDDLRLMVMSATLDPEPIVRFLGNAIGVESRGRAFPVSTQYIDVAPRTRIESAIMPALDQALADTDGDVLVFLPGVGEIRGCAAALSSNDHEDSAIDVRQLYGDQSPEQQASGLTPSDRRRVILSTNVAETSVTIDGVTAVIDSGKARVLGFDAKVGLPRLHLQNISIASADQRAGRAGRTAPGIAYRLWSSASHRGRPERDLPEIARTDLASARLMLLAWGEKDASEFPFLTAPAPDQIEAADKLLRRLGAIDDQLNVTKIGGRINSMPLHPRMGRMMIDAERDGVTWPVSLIAGMLTSRDPFRSDRQASPLNVFERLERLHDFVDGKSHAVANPSAARALVRVARQVERSVTADAGRRNQNPRGDLALIESAVFGAYPDRLCQRREAGKPSAVMVGRRGITWTSAAALSDWFVALDVDGAASEAKLRLAMEMDQDAISPELIRERLCYEFDQGRGCVIARRRKMFEDLVISESPAEVQPCDEVTQVLVDAAMGSRGAALPDDRSAFIVLWNRIKFLNSHWPEGPWPVAGDETLIEILKDVCQGKTSFKQVRSGPWHDYLVARIGYETRQAIEEAVPSEILLPSGNRTRVIYDLDSPPRIEVKLQELFGWQESPRIAGGRVALQLHLLSPARRVEQITDDLSNFWNVTYQQVRKDLRGRYPKHYWPEDPVNAKATHNGLKPRGK